ncbi:MAG: hypothetical protein F4X20_08525 [Dehalococcoidia bacterium]|nr:hypothetical protein [Dehalococcoidia bacterium]
MTTMNDHETTNEAGGVNQDDAPHESDEPTSSDQPTIEAMQAELAARDERVSALEEHLITLERELSTTVSRYRLALLDTAPEVPGDLVSGTTAEELESSLAKAKGVVEQVRTRLLEGMESESRDTEQPGPGIPAGAPPHTLNDGSADLTAREKITLGLERM